MGGFDMSEWPRHKPIYIIMIILLVIVVIYIRKHQTKESRGNGIKGRKVVDGNGTSTYYGRGSKHDDVEELLNRIDWATYLSKRTVLWYRVVPMVIIITVLIMLLVVRKLLSPPKLIVLMLCIFIPIYAMTQFYYVHGDIYNDYYVKRNVDIIRRKLNLDRDEPKAPKCEVPKRTDVMNPK